MSGLIHRLDQVTDDMIGVTCAQCRARYPIDELPTDPDGSFRCHEHDGELGSCNCAGMIPRRTGRVSDRFPEQIAAPFTPLPDALMEHREDLGLSPHELLVVWALERHRRNLGDEVWPSALRLRKLTGLSDGQLKRATRSLTEAGLVERRRPRTPSGVLAASRYRLDPLWKRVAELATGHQRPVAEVAFLHNHGS